jgi:hypothetical protein
MRVPSNDKLVLKYRIVHVELLDGDLALAFKALSHTWGNHAKVSALQL